MKKFKILSLSLAVMLILALLPVSALAVDEPSISAQSAVIIDAESGEVYYEKNPDRILQPASTTKIMTALLTVEAVERGDISLNDTVTASEGFDSDIDTEATDARPRIVAGETMTVEDLLYCTMLVSANEACNVLAEYVSGSVSAFVSEMNARARQLGCENTHFNNANGLEDEDHYSTAMDFARIAQEAMSHPVFQQICGTLHYTVPATNVSDARELTNTNNLLDPDTEFYYEYAYGIKTGFFTNAGYCLVSAAEKDNMNVICVVMGGPEFNDQFRDSLTLYQWLFDNYEVRQILSSAETVATVPVELGTADSTGVRAEDAVSVILPRDYDASRISYQYVLYHEAQGEKLSAPVNAGQVVGEITVVELDENQNVVRTFGTSLLVAASSVDMSRTDYIRSQIRDLFQEPVVRKIITILIILLAIYILLVAFYYVQRLRHLSSLRKAKQERARRQTAEESRWLTMPESRRYELEEEPEEEKKPLPAVSSARSASGQSAARSSSKSAGKSSPKSSAKSTGKSKSSAKTSGGQSARKPAPAAPVAEPDPFASPEPAAPAEDPFAEFGDLDLGKERFSGDDFGMDDFFKSRGEQSVKTETEEAKPKSSASSATRPSIHDPDFSEDDFFDSFFK